MLPITALYAGILGLISIALGFQVGAARLRTGISILHGENMELATTIRRHANFIENVPLALVLLGALELNGAGSGLLHGLGIALVVCRLLHPIGLRHDDMRQPLRGIGAGGTTLVILISSLLLIWGFLSA
jgi:uncharacterized membrane protein YecN with MAPEG domain